MNIKRIDVSDILLFLTKDVLKVSGAVDGVYIDNLADVAHVTESSLDWVKPSTSSQQIAEQSKARVLLVGDDVHAIDGKVLIHVNNPKRALAKVGNHFFVKRFVPCIHPTAIIDTEAIIGEGVYVGPYTVIGKAVIGDGCVIDSHVHIYDDVSMGKNCRIKSGAVIGGEGFGFETDEEGNKFRFPQIGNVFIGDDVEIGANTCIDRGALSDTVIGDHTKINNLCHVAHNNRIGKNVTITACVNISGSNVIDDNVWIAPNASVRGFIHLGEGCLLGMGAVATKDIPAGETWVGNPARKLERN